MPLLGNINTLRALLAGISRLRANVIILDFTGVPLLDSTVPIDCKQEQIRFYKPLARW